MHTTRVQVVHIVSLKSMNRGHGKGISCCSAVIAGIAVVDRGEWAEVPEPPGKQNPISTKGKNPTEEYVC
jgi:hypothetical protein